MKIARPLFATAGLIAAFACQEARDDFEGKIAPKGSRLEVARTAVEIQLVEISDFDAVLELVESLSDEDFAVYREDFEMLHEQMHRAGAYMSTEQTARFARELERFLRSRPPQRQAIATSGRGLCMACPYPCSHSSGWCPQWPCAFGEMCGENYCWFCTEIEME
jgi:hypothetical protein